MRPARCSVLSAEVEEQLVGSAPEAVGWFALEQEGPWGAKAFTESHLDPELGRTLEQTATAVGVRPCLVRRPGRHADADPRAPRHVLLAHTRPGATWLLAGRVDDPTALLTLDWSAVAAGDADAVHRSLPALVPSSEPQLLVCTNGTRDVCCAALGRPVVVGAAAAYPGRVWEVTHTSGHRFAPTSVLLPSGVLHGRLTAERAIAVLAAAGTGELVLAGYRGRSSWPGAAQAAELAVRESTGDTGMDALSVRLDGERWRVDHTDGRSWLVRVEREPAGTVRPESCGKDAVAVHRWRTTLEDASS